MKKKYLSPEFDFHEIEFVEDILNISDPHETKSGTGSGGGAGETDGPLDW
ncbi:MAG: hypothetical protein J1E96_01515 [Ruminococcus sp.]|nr:hypothetical protein [Ruminococcus sp.]